MSRARRLTFILSGALAVGGPVACTNDGAPSASKAPLSGGPQLECPPYAGDQALPELTPLPNVAAPRAGEIGGSFAVSSAGSATYTIPLGVPPGRHGMAPGLALTYDSSGESGYLGKGFSLAGLSSIARCGSNVAQDGAYRGVALDAGDHVCLDGQRLVPVGSGSDVAGSYVEYRTFPDTQTKVLGYSDTEDPSFPRWFMAYTADGRRHEYGRTPAARALHRDGIIRSWNIQRSADRHGNTVEYEYEASVATVSGSTMEQVPSRIRYGGHVNAQGAADVAPMQEVVFEYFDAPLWRTEQFYKGETLVRERVLKKIETRSGGAPVRLYAFTYDYDKVTKQLLVWSVDECAAGDSQQCKPITTFEWSNTPHGGFSATSLGFSAPPEYTDKRYTWTLADVTGDGLPDLVESRTDEDTGANTWHVRKNLGGGSFAPAAKWASFGYPAGFPGADKRRWWKVAPLDYDHDGRVDLMIDEPNITGWPTRRVLVSRAQPTPHFELVDTGLPHMAPYQQQSNYSDASIASWMLADVNADGMPDLVDCFDPRAWEGHADYVDCPNDGYTLCEPSLASWGVRLWTPAGGAAGGAGFEGQRRTIPDLDGISCWTMDRYVAALDWDADGQTELLAPGLDGVLRAHKLDTRTMTWSSTTAGIGSFPPHVNYPETLKYAQNHPHYRVLFPDANGDGLPDVLLLGEANNGVIAPYLAVNKGDATFDLYPSAYPAMPNADGDPESGSDDTSYTFMNHAYARVLDYNGDGRDDLLLPVPRTCDSDGDGDADDMCYVAFVSRRPGETASPVVTAIPWEGDSEAPAPRFLLRTTDIDGDQLVDIVSPTNGAEIPVFTSHRNLGSHDRVIRISTGLNPLDPTDGVNPPEPGFVPDVEITYGNLVDRSQGEVAPAALEALTYLPRADAGNGCAYPRTCVVGGAPVVASYRLNDGKNQQRRFVMQYRDGRAHRLGRGFLGFGARVTRDLDTGGGTIEWADNTTFDPTFRTFPYAGRTARSWTWTPAAANDPDPARVDMRFSLDVPLLRPTNGGATYFVRSQLTEARAEQGAFGASAGLTLLEYVTAEPHAATVTTDRWTRVDAIDDFGHTLRSTSWTMGVNQTDTTTRTITNIASAWRLGEVDNEVSCSAVPGETQCREVSNIHDARGELHSSVRAKGHPSAERNVVYTRDAFGNVIHVLASDALGNTRESCVTYEPRGMFPWAARNGEGHTSYTRFEWGLGVLLSRKDPNGLVTKHRYDGFGRVVEIHRPDGVTTRSLTRAKDGGPNGNWWTLHLAEQTPGQGAFLVDLDAKLRPVREGMKGPDVPMTGISLSGSGLWIVKEREYDLFGRLVRESLPHIDGDQSAAAIAATTRYDAAGRVIARVSPTGAKTIYAHDARWVHVTSPATADVPATTTSTLHDALGRPVFILDAATGTTLRTYGPFGHLTSSTGPDLAVSTWHHDEYGRPDLTVDPDRGSTQVSYDGFDEAVSVTDALQRTYTSTFDRLGRLVERRQGGGITTFVFDTAPHGVGKLARTISPEGHVREVGYDALGRPNRAALTLADGQSFVAGSDYDAAGRLRSITYPSPQGALSFGAVYSYDTTGRVVEVSATTGAVSSVLWHLDAVDGAGRTTRETFGNGVGTTRDYVPATGALRSIVTVNGALAKLQDLSYFYDKRLNVTQRVDKRLKKAEYFHYDELDRLTCTRVATCKSWGGFDCIDLGGACDVDIDYEPNGNIHQKSDVGQYTYDPLHPHAAATAGADGFGHDAVGNQTSRPGWTIEYNDFDLPTRYVPEVGQGQPIVLDYDASQQRIRKVRGEDETIYHSSLYERATSAGAVEHRYYVSNGERVIAVDSRTLGGAAPDVTTTDAFRFLHVDHLGSIDVVTGDGGVEVQRRSYDAFGAQRAPAWNGSKPPVSPAAITLDFTGHELDAEIELVNAKGRIYDPRLGRFLQTDPLVVNPLSSQSWNRYSYVHNNPLGFTDPTGFQEEEVAVSVLLQGSGAPGYVKPDEAHLAQDHQKTVILRPPGRERPTPALGSPVARQDAADEKAPSTTPEASASVNPLVDVYRNYAQPVNFPRSVRREPLVLSSDRVLRFYETVTPYNCLGGSDCLRVSTHGNPVAVQGPYGPSDSIDVITLARYIRESPGFKQGGKPPEVVFLSACNTGSPTPDGTPPLAANLAVLLGIPVVGAAGYVDNFDIVHPSSCQGTCSLVEGAAASQSHPRWIKFGAGWEQEVIKEYPTNTQQSIGDPGLGTFPM